VLRSEEAVPCSFVPGRNFPFATDFECSPRGVPVPRAAQDLRPLPVVPVDLDVSKAWPDRLGLRRASESQPVVAGAAAVVRLAIQLQPLAGPWSLRILLLPRPALRHRRPHPPGRTRACRGIGWRPSLARHRGACPDPARKDLSIPLSAGSFASELLALQKRFDGAVFAQCNENRQLLLLAPSRKHLNGSVQPKFSCAVRLNAIPLLANRLLVGLQRFYIRFLRGMALGVPLGKHSRKTVAVSSAPPEGLASSSIVWRRASAPFALGKNCCITT
jgi:hypothetical protein